MAVGQSVGPSQPQSLPRFEDFKVPTPLPERKDPAVIERPWPLLPGGPVETDDQFDGRIRKSARSGPNFAGHYAVVLWSCGSICFNVAIVDVQSGHIYDTPFVGVSGCLEDLDNPLSYRIDSRLFVVSGSLEIPDEHSQTFHDGPCGVHYYEWNGRSLHLLKSKAFQHPEEQNQR